MLSWWSNVTFLKGTNCKSSLCHSLLRKYEMTTTHLVAAKRKQTLHGMSLCYPNKSLVYVGTYLWLTKPWHPPHPTHTPQSALRLHKCWEVGQCEGRAQLTVADLETLAPHRPQGSGRLPPQKLFQPKRLHCQTAFTWGSQDIRAPRRKNATLQSCLDTLTAFWMARDSSRASVPQIIWKESEQQSKSAGHCAYDC